MKLPRFKAACLFASAALLLAASLAAQNLGDKMLDLLEKDYKPEAPLLAPDVKIVQEFKDTAGEPAGLVEFVENEAYIIHADEQNTAYKAAKNNLVCVGDTLVAEAGSNMAVLLKDQSKFTLASYSKMTIDKSVYDPDRNFRDTVLDLAAGKARVVAKKLQAAGEENFKVKTPVATCGIRGSDFVVSLVPANQLPDWRSSFWDNFAPAQAHAQNAPPGGSLSLVVLTGADTRLSVTGPVGPPVIMESFNISASYTDRPPQPP
ncbi:MAG: FecR domain-containing protein, partial [Desulfovibrionaceae bacterium]|nr:FecR domain-containing protein [Desulfovibrionaceae bacterium]